MSLNFGTKENPALVRERDQRRDRRLCAGEKPAIATFEIVMTSVRKLLSLMLAFPRA